MVVFRSFDGGLLASSHSNGGARISTAHFFWIVLYNLRSPYLGHWEKLS